MGRFSLVFVVVVVVVAAVIFICIFLVSCVRVGVSADLIFLFRLNSWSISFRQRYCVFFSKCS